MKHTPYTRYEVAPVVSYDGGINDFDTESAAADKLRELKDEGGNDPRLFWSLYGWSEETQSVCIGDFGAEEAALCLYTSRSTSFGSYPHMARQGQLENLRGASRPLKAL